MHDKENDEVLMENVTPEDLPQEGETQPFVPSPKWKRVFAWVLFAIVILAIAAWLLNIADPTWAEKAREWLKGLFG